MTPALPTVLVSYALGSASPVEIIEAADGLCEVTFLVDSRQKHARTVLPFLREMTDTLDLAHLSPETIASQLAGRAQGITTYSDFLLAETAAVAQRLGLPFHPPEVVDALTNKARQRALLNDSGMPALRQVSVRGPAEFERAVQEIGLPAVIKPVRGTASVDVYPCRSLAEVQAIVPSADRGNWLVEEMLPAGRHPTASWLGDYCSVETAVSDGHCWHFSIVERLPLTPPFRESGFLTPDSLPDAYRARVLEVAEASIRAVGITNGITHVEIKFTPDGPRVIEVNGRVGGTTGRLLRRAGDLDPIRLALEIALGEDVKPREVVFDRCVLAYRVLPPLRPVTVRTLWKPSAFRAHPAVWAVDGGVPAGQPLDWRRGGLDQLFTVWAEAENSAALPPVIRHLADAAADCVTYDD